MLADPWGRGERSRRHSRDAIGNTGLEESTGGIRHEDTTGHELFELGHGRAVEEGTRWDPEQSGRFQDLFCGVPRGVVVDGGQELLTAAKSLGDLRKVGVSHQVGPLDHEQEVLELLGAVRGDDEVSVPRGLDGGNLDRPSRPRHLGPPGKRGEHRGVRDHGDGHAVEHRHIDQLPMAAAKGLAKRSDRPQRGIGTRRPLAEATAGGQRRVFRESALPDGPARGLQGELSARPTSPGPLATERRNRDDHQ